MKNQIVDLGRVEKNYLLLNSLYKQGKFEDKVKTTTDFENPDGFYYSPSDKLITERKFTLSENELRGAGRNAQDLQWATRNLREQAQFLFEECLSLPDENSNVVILCYYRAISLSYEVDDYFLDVSAETSNFLIDLTEEIIKNFEVYISQYDSHFSKDSEKYLELMKQVLVVVLCGVNEFYRKHRYEDGLEKAQIVKQFLAEYSKTSDNLEGRWHGLRGLCSFIMGKIYTSLSKFGEAELEFSNSVEAYSESIWQKEQVFYNKQASTVKSHNKNHQEYNLKQEHEISRSVALRRIGLVTSFGYAFQSLVLGKVKDAIYLSSVARGIVNWNTGKVWSAYVDLIYFSAKRAENSSDIDVLLEIKKNLNHCYDIFVNLIPSGHYKNRALFQIALVNHYLARWHKEKAQELEKSDEKDKALKEFKQAQEYWYEASDNLKTTINDDKLILNKRLRAESMAIWGHTLSNLGLLAKIFQEDGSREFEQANAVLKIAWNEAAEYPQIKCEVGLAKAAVGKAHNEYLMDIFLNKDIQGKSSNSSQSPVAKDVEAEINENFKKSFQVLHEVLELNKGNSIRIEATAYLRLTELALMQKDTRSQAYKYFNNFKEISSRVEHEFCYRWAHQLEKEVLYSHTFTIRPTELEVGKPRFFNKQEDFENELNEYFANYAVYHATIKIEQDYLKNREHNREFKKTSSISSYLQEELKGNFGLHFREGQNLYDKYNMFERVRKKISPNEVELPNERGKSKEKDK